MRADGGTDLSLSPVSPLFFGFVFLIQKTKPNQTKIFDVLHISSGSLVNLQNDIVKHVKQLAFSILLPKNARLTDTSGSYFFGLFPSS